MWLFSNGMRQNRWLGIIKELNERTQKEFPFFPLTSDFFFLYSFLGNEEKQHWWWLRLHHSLWYVSFSQLSFHAYTLSLSRSMYFTFKDLLKFSSDRDFLNFRLLSRMANFLFYFHHSFLLHNMSASYKHMWNWDLEQKWFFKKLHKDIFYECEFADMMLWLLGMVIVVRKY